jgi:thioredoxin reductase (NADPH)
MELSMTKDSIGNPPELASGGSRYHQVYPTLDERQLAILEGYGKRLKLKQDDILYSEGDRHTGMFAILSGTIESFRASVEGPRSLGTHGPGTFTGEVATLAGRAAVATTRAVSNCEVIAIDEESLRALVIAEAELSETIMRAYILRRVAFIQGQQIGLIVIGSTSSGATISK